jgi:DNA mismatch repair protein MutL
MDVHIHLAGAEIQPEKGGRSAYPLVVGTIRAALSPDRGPGIGVPEEGEGTELIPIGQFDGRCIIAQV